MGAATAQAFAEAVEEGEVDLGPALHYHLTSNHYPPLPSEYVDVAQRVITWANEHEDIETVDWSTLIELPEDINPRPRESYVAEVDGQEVLAASAGHLVEILHLSAFLRDES